MKGFRYTNMTLLASVVAIAICVSQMVVNSKQPDTERSIAVAASHSNTISDEDPQQPINVSIIRLVANPEAYDGKYVRITGFVSLRFEGTAAYLSQADYRNFIGKNAIWLELSRAQQRTYQSSDQKYAYIEGIFNAKYNGHLNAFSGSLVKITRLDAKP